MRKKLDKKNDYMSMLFHYKCFGFPPEALPMLAKFLHSFSGKCICLRTFSLRVNAKRIPSQ